MVTWPFRPIFVTDAGLMPAFTHKSFFFMSLSMSSFQSFSLNQRDIFQHVPITSRKPVMPDSKGVPGFFAFWGSSRILMNPGAS